MQYCHLERTKFVHLNYFETKLKLSIIFKNVFILVANAQSGGSTVQIKIPVVATVIQQNDRAGQLSMSVLSPGPNGEFVDQPGLSNSKVSSLLYNSFLTDFTQSIK